MAHPSENSLPIKCNHCDESSPLMTHEISVTRFRVNNLCCGAEEVMIHKAMKAILGVEETLVNVIGRYMVVKHCKYECCSPTAAIEKILNDLHLGVSVADTSLFDEDDDSDDKEDFELKVAVLHAIVCAVFFIAGCLLTIDPDSTEYEYCDIVLTIGIGIGLVPVFYRAWVSTYVRKMVDMNILIIMTTCGALYLDDAVDASLLVTLYICATLAEKVLMGYIRSTFKQQSSKSPTKCMLASGKAVNISDVVVGDVLSARAGDMMPCDGVITSGTGNIDESAMTGEPMPLSKEIGNRVLGGSVLLTGYIEIEVDVPVQDAAINKFRQQVQDAQSDGGENVRLMHRFSAIYTPLVAISAIAYFVIGGSINNNWPEYLERGITLMVLACPCSIVLALPLPSICAMSLASKFGVLIMGATAMEGLAEADTIASDKTGTLTTGLFRVIDELRMSDAADGDYDPLELAAALEAKSSHPLASAIVAYHTPCVSEFVEAGLKLPEVRNVEIVKGGFGVSGWVEHDDDFKHVLVGSLKILKDRAQGGKVHATKQQLQQIEEFELGHATCSFVLIVIEDELDIILALNDGVRQESKACLESFRNLGCEVNMLTGDQTAAAHHVATEVGIAPECVYSQLTPTGKLDWVLDMQSKNIGKVNTSEIDSKYEVVVDIDLNSESNRVELGQISKNIEERVNITQKEYQNRKVVMIGDGINDALALAEAHVGVAMGAGGTALACKAAKVILMSDKLTLLPATMQLCRYSKLLVFVNLAVSIGIKAIAIILSFNGILPLAAAVFVDVGSLFVVSLIGLSPMLSTVYTSTTNEKKDATDNTDGSNQK
jgi:Zn2+/Cd2+-exporting ATPase